MFKDYKKYLSTSLKVYLFVLVIIFILKIVGLDYFGIDINNRIIVNVSNFLEKMKLINVWYYITLTYYSYIMYCIISGEKSKKNLITAMAVSLINIILLMTLKKNMNQVQIAATDFIIYIIGARICSKEKIGKFLLKSFLVFLINIVYQLISLVIKNVHYKDMNIDNNVLWLILNLDYIILMYLTFIFIVERRNIKWEEVGSFSLKKINLKKSLQRLQKNLQNKKLEFSKKSKEEKLTIIIFTILSLIWNTLTVLLVLLIAFVNDTIIECIFILTSFWLSKTSFGKPFHFNSMAICFVVSNLTYYILNRITAPLGISIIIPILLGVGLSYITSKFVKKTYKPLYRGMPKDLFEETILQVTEKDSDKYNICYEFYIDKKSDISLSYKYKYSVPGIRKIRDRINNKIKRL